MTFLLSLLAAGAVAYGVLWWFEREGAGREAEDFAVVRTEAERAVADLEARLDARLGGIEAGSTGLGARLDALGDGSATDDLAARLDALDARLAGTETGARDADARVGGLEQRLADLAARVDALAAAFPEGGEAVAPAALTPLRSALSAQDARLTQLSEDLAALDARLTGLADLPGRLDALSGEVGTLRQEAQANREALSGEVDALRREAQGARDALASDVATLRQDAEDGQSGMSDDIDALRQEARAARDALSNDLATLRQEAEQARGGLSGDIDALRGEVEAVGARVDRRESAVEAEVARARAQADAEANAARAEAALARMRAQIDAGAPYQSALTDLLGAVDAPVPATLLNEAATGVPTLAALREEFAPLSREALLAAPAGEDAGRVESFVRRNLGVRSLGAREGSDADAVLSRAEDALGRGDIEAALAELEALPEPARAPFEPWIASAKDRVIVEGAAASLADRLEGG